MKKILNRVISEIGFWAYLLTGRLNYDNINEQATKFYNRWMLH